MTPYQEKFGDCCGLFTMIDYPASGKIKQPVVKPIFDDETFMIAFCGVADNINWSERWEGDRCWDYLLLDQIEPLNIETKHDLDFICMLYPTLAKYIIKHCEGKIQL